MANITDMVTNFYSVIRLSNSSYFEHDFIEKECRSIESLGNTKYYSSPAEFKGGGPVILISNTHSQLESFDKTEVKLIVHPNSGYDNFNIDYVKQSHFPIVIGNPIRTQAVSEFILSSLFDHFTPLPKQGQWSKERNYSRDLISSKKVLIIGYGQIGQKVKGVLEALGCSIQVFDPFKFSSSLDEILDSFIPDIVIVVASLNPTSDRLFNKAQFNKLKSNIVLINTSRGEIISQQEMINFSRKNPESRFYIDVFEQEPCDFKQFNSQFILSSHMAGVYNSLTEEMIKLEVQVIKDFITNNNFEKKYQEFLLKNKIKDSYFI